MTVSFEVSKADRTLISRIVDRWAGIARSYTAEFDRMGATMDLTACHANGNPLRLEDLLDADGFNFVHDVGGISRHLDRDTGKLQNHFSPRFSVREMARG